MSVLKIWNNLGHNFRRVYIPQHILFLAGIISIITGHTSAWWLLLVYPAWFLFGHIGFGIFIHKYWCHKSFKTQPWIARLGGYLGSLAGTGSPIMLAGLHIGYHHRYSDTDQDPHTPRKGFWWSYFLWLNHKWDFKNSSVRKVVRDLMRDPYLKFLHKNYYKIYWATFLVLCLIDWRLAVFSMSAATVIEFHLSGIVNTYGHTPHRWSYQNYQVDDSQNIPWLNWLTLGLGLHNNHHGRPGEYNYAHKKGEIDFAAWFVPLIEIKEEKNGQN